MSLLADKIKQLLIKHDLPEHPSIKALRALNSADQNNIFKVYQCFVENLPKEEEAAYVVYQEIMKQVSKFKPLDYTVSLLNFLIKENLTTQNISNLLCKFLDLFKLLSIFEYLKNSQLLTQENLDDNNNPLSFYKHFMILREITLTPDFGPLSQELLDLIKRNPNDSASFLNLLFKNRLVNLQNLVRLLQIPEDSYSRTMHAMHNVWNRIPTHLFTPAVLDQLIRLSQQQNPERQIRRYVNQLLGVRENQVELNREVLLNDQQSTHRASVHQSVSDSASKLFKLYGFEIEGNRLQDILEMIHHYIMQLPENSLKNTAAKNCLERIIKFEFTDPGSGLTIPQLMALSFLAIHDHAKRVGDLSDAREQFVEGLYEIQRGYNLAENGYDRGGPDTPICTAGTFNKLIEKLEGIHPDVEVLHITPANASLKLPIVVREVALDYLSSLAKPQTIEGFQRFTQLIERIRQDECIDSIWKQIKPKITNRMFAEFGSLYSGKADPRLNGLIESGQYLKLENLSRFQQQIVASSGYRHYCSQILRSPANFFSQQSAIDSEVSCSQQSHDVSRRFGF